LPEENQQDADVTLQTETNQTESLHMTFKPIMKLTPIPAYQLPIGSSLQQPRVQHPVDNYNEIPKLISSNPRSSLERSSINSPARMPKKMTNLRAQEYKQAQIEPDSTSFVECESPTLPLDEKEVIKKALIMKN
jgi:hypothetical protein